MPDLFGNPDGVARAADLSSCGRYRYSLSRVWDTSQRLVCWVMLNPSTADAEQDDPTICRCTAFAKAWGAGGIHVVNLFALRATDPDELRRAADPVGPENDGHIFRAAYGRGVVVAWGVHGGLLKRDQAVLRLLVSVARANQPVACLGLTRQGHPRYPLYVAGDTEPVLFPRGEW